MKTMEQQSASVLSVWPDSAEAETAAPVFAEPARVVDVGAAPAAQEHLVEVYRWRTVRCGRNTRRGSVVVSTLRGTV